MHPILNLLNERHEETVGLIGRMAECESPTDAPSAVTAMADLVIEETRDIARGKTVNCGPKAGRAVMLEFDLPGPKRKTGAGVLGLGHIDTVWPVGTLKTMPLRREEGRLWGPGVFDMKSGIAFFIQAMRALRDLDMAVKRPVRMWLAPDEETGSDASRAMTEKHALAHAAVMVMEPGTGREGKLKTARKGVGVYIIQAHGVAAHAGVDFAAGASAITEIARQIVKVAGFCDLSKGLTLNPGTVAGGGRHNVVAERAMAEIDIRVRRIRDYEALDKKIQKLKAEDPRCRLTIEGGLNRPPMERTKAIAGLFKTAKAIAKRDLGIVIDESETGGGSDGNFTAGIGAPTLDGLGGVGEGAHAPHESIFEDRIDDRAALAALLVHHLGQ
ncbi:MAG: peptidase M20 [Candidatus Solibacter sp.]|nr:peptidase M20 [Candidatus Solibacter sp.]